MFGFPFVQQHDSMQCGVACLQMIIKYYGLNLRGTERSV